MPGASQDASNSALQIDVADFLTRRRGLLILGANAGLILAVMYILTTPIIYESNAEILVIPKDSKLTTSSNAEFGFESTVADELLATHMRIVTSPRVVSDALRENDLFELPSLTEKIDEDTTEPKERRKAIVRYVKENLSIRRGGDGGAKEAQVLDVTFRHTSDVDCSEILLAVVNSYQDFLGEKIQGAGDEAATLIEEASGQLEVKLAEQDQAYKDYLQDSPTLLWAGLNPQQITVTQLQTELSTVQIKRAEVESRLALTQGVIAKSKSGEDGSLEKLTVLDKDDIDRVSLLVQLERGYPNSESFEALRPKLNEVAGVEYQELLSLKVQARTDELKYGKNHPKAVATREQIEELKGFLAKRDVTVEDDAAALNSDALDLNRLVAIYERLLRNDLDDLQSRETELLKLIVQEKEVAKTVILAQLEETNLKREMERTQGLYDAVLDRLGEINLLKDYGGFITDVISPVEIGEKAWPSIPLIGLMGLLLGTMGGAGLAVAAELADKSFRNPKDIEHELGVPILTHVSQLNLDKIIAREDHPIHKSIVTVHSPRSRYAEAFRSLRTSVFFRTKAVSNPVIQVTSPNAGDGKSTIISNLAVSISQTGKSVLLVDCDMRRPMISKVFGLNDSSGLAEVLTGEANLLDAAVKCPDAPNLSVIASDKIPGNPAELLALPDFADFIEKARQQFDFVLLDSPPVSPVADPLTIASIADFVLLGLTLRKNSRTIATRTCAELSSNGAEMLGLVVNRAATETNRYGYSNGRYGAGYGTSYRYGGYGNYGGDRYETQTANDAYYG